MECTHPPEHRKLILYGYDREFCTACREFILLSRETELPPALKKENRKLPEKRRFRFPVRRAQP